MDIIVLVMIVLAWFWGFTVGIIVGWIWYHRGLEVYIKKIIEEDYHGQEE